MAEPKQKSFEIESYLRRSVPLWTSPQWLEAERWRRVVENQPVAMVCENTLVADLTGSDWGIRAKDKDQQESLEADIEHYKSVLSPELVGGLGGFDPWVSMVTKDYLSLPVGGNTEVVRYPDGLGPLSMETSKGHVYKIVYIDGATLSPTYDPEFTMVQKVKGPNNRPVYFSRDEVMRVVSSPRVRMAQWGYGMPPPERIFLAINMLYRGDSYYASLLLDTPEAGLLDLLDMSKEDAGEWLTSFRSLFEGIDPFKIPVLYQHEKPAQYIPFNRPPTDLMLDSTTEKYAKLSCAGYGLTLSDIGMGDPQKTLAGTIRDERKSRRSGFMTTREAVKTSLNKDVIPDYLEFFWLENDEEARVQKGRAFLVAVQALSKAQESRFISPAEGQAQLLKEGHITVEVAEPEALPLPAPANGSAAAASDEARKVPPAQGGRGEITKAVMLNDDRIAAIPRDSSAPDSMARILEDVFSKIIQEATPENLDPLIEQASLMMFPTVQQALQALSEADRPTWKAERALYWEGQPSEFDRFALVVRAREEVFNALDEIMNQQNWWEVEQNTTSAFQLIMSIAYEEGAIDGAHAVQNVLFHTGKSKEPSLTGFNFNLKNPQTIDFLEAKAAQLIVNINQGSKFYIKRMIVKGVDEGLSSPRVADMIREGATLENLQEAGFNAVVRRDVLRKLPGMKESRIKSIVNTEIARAETEGRLSQWQVMGLKKKDGYTPEQPAQVTHARSVKET